MFKVEVGGSIYTEPSRIKALGEVLEMILFAEVQTGRVTGPKSHRTQITLRSSCSLHSAMSSSQD